MKRKGLSTRTVVLTILLGAVIIGAGCWLGLHTGGGGDQQCDNTVKPVTGEPEFKSASGSYQYAAVVTGSEICSQVGNDILARHRGNAVDAAVAALFCIGVVYPHSAGIGGGSFFTVYHKSSGQFYSVDSRETAPAAANRDMYTAPENRRKSVRGGQAAGVPGEVLGLYQLYTRLGSGSVAWSALVLPTARLCEDGVPLSKATHIALNRVKNLTGFDPYFNGKTPHSVGTKIKLPELARTYRAIADDPMSFYTGTLAEQLVEDLSEKDGIITKSDLENYQVAWRTPTKMDLPGNLSVYSIPPPGSGPVLSYILGILAGYGMGPQDIATTDKEVLTLHRAAEAFKFAFSKRSELGDGFNESVPQMMSQEFCDVTRQKIDDLRTHPTQYYSPHFDNTEDAGTAHLSVIDGDGNAVSATSTINHYFGNKVRGRRTGVVFNNEMDDFSIPHSTNSFGLPASPANYISPGKRPMSSMCPAIVFDHSKQRVRMVTGAAGGSKITTTTAMNILDVLWLGLSLPESVDRPRHHHQLFPETLMIEHTFKQEIRLGLQRLGHKLSPKSFGISVVQAIDVTDTAVVGTADFRKGGEPKGF